MALPREGGPGAGSSLGTFQVTGRSTIGPGRSTEIGVSANAANGTFQLLNRGSLSSVVKPFTATDLLLQKLQRLRPKDGEETEAEVFWGKVSEFKITDSSEDPDDGDVIVDWPKDPDSLDHFDVEIPTLEFEEVEREEEDIRIENPDDSDQYVIEARATWIKFKGPDLRPADAAGGLSKAVITITDPETGAQLTTMGIPSQFRLPYIYYKLTFHYPTGPVP